MTKHNKGNKCGVLDSQTLEESCRYVYEPKPQREDYLIKTGDCGIELSPELSQIAC